MIIKPLRVKRYLFTDSNNATLGIKHRIIHCFYMTFDKLIRFNNKISKIKIN